MNDHEQRLAALAAQIGTRIPGLPSEIACAHGYIECRVCEGYATRAAMLVEREYARKLARERADKFEFFGREPVREQARGYRIPEQPTPMWQIAGGSAGGGGGNNSGGHAQGQSTHDNTIWCHVCDRVAYHTINIPHVCDDGVMRTLVPHTLEILCEDGVMRAAISNTREIK